MFSKSALFTVVSMAVFVSAAPGFFDSLRQTVPIPTEVVPVPRALLSAAYGAVPTSIVDAISIPTDVVPAPEDVVPRWLLSAAYGATDAIPTVTSVVGDVDVPNPTAVVPRALLSAAYGAVPTVVDTSAVVSNPTAVVPSVDEVVPRSLYNFATSAVAVPPIPTDVVPSTADVVPSTGDVVDAIPRDSGLEDVCETGAVQCCNSLYDATSTQASYVLGLLDIVVGGITGQVGLSCSPVGALAVNGGSSCTSQPVCCVKNDFNGLVNLGCTPANVGL